MGDVDLDAELARQLQAEEQMAAKQDGTHAFIDRLHKSMDTVKQCEDELLQAMALSLMPLEEIEAAVDAQLQLNSILGEKIHLGREDLMAQGLLQWFKHKFFSWVDKPACHNCHNKDTQAKGQAPPTAEERAHQALRVEVYSCRECGKDTRFPRYNDVEKLLSTRCGRCGEWANAFLLFARAAGLSARYVMDWTDHVWEEYYSNALGRWVHVDPCEAAWDTPLVYEQGWGKQLTYVIAVSMDGFVDVTRRYTKRWDDTRAQRREVPEPWLVAQLGKLTSALRAGLPTDRVRQLQARDLAEQIEMISNISSGLSPKDAALPGRTTGSLEWRAARGETGSQAQQVPQAPTASTSYVFAPDTKLPSLFQSFGSVCGGACKASGDNRPSESVDKAFDRRACTKWLCFQGGGVGGTAWVEYRIPPTQAPVIIQSYDIVSANDSPERDPKDWVLEAAVEDQPAATATAGAAAEASTSAVPERVTWAPLDQRKGVIFSSRFQLQSFDVTCPRPCHRVRLRVTSTRTPAEANSMQIACINLYHDRMVAPANKLGECVDACAKAVIDALLTGTADDKAMATLQKVLSNIVHNPHESKYKRVRASKVSELTSSQPITQLLACVGFRPLMLQPETNASAAGANIGQAEDTFVVFGEGPETLPAATRALQVLQQAQNKQ